VSDAPATPEARATIPQSEWAKRRVIVRIVVALCCAVIVASWVYNAFGGTSGAIEKLADSAFYLLGFTLAVYVGAPVADDAFHKFAIAKVANKGAA
jgi:hypothetical protein